jgi:ABC-type branched-subunit amino acid transport system ATPase component
VLVPLSATLDAKLADVLSYLLNTPTATDGKQVDFSGIQGVVYGIAIIAVIMLAPDGVFWRVRDHWLRRRSRLATPSSTPQAVSAPLAAASAEAFTVAGGGPASLLEVRNLSKAFGGLQAVSDVTLEVRRGEILGIIGPNGAGKTTFFNLLNGFTPPDRGEVRLDGENIVGKRASDICRRGVGRTFQVVKPFRRMTIADNVVIGSYVRTRTDVEADALAAHAIAAVGLTQDANLIAGSMSNLQLRLMELARALASKPTLLLLDEIFAGLTSGEVEQVMTVIRRLNKLGITIAIIEHTMRAMVQLVDRFVVLDHGSVLTEGTPDIVTKNPKVIEAYLGKKWVTNA